MNSIQGTGFTFEPEDDGGAICAPGGKLIAAAYGDSQEDCAEMVTMANDQADCLEVLQRLSTAIGEANALQHAGLDVPKSVWSNLYQIDLEARALIGKQTATQAAA